MRVRVCLCVWGAWALEPWNGDHGGCSAEACCRMLHAHSRAYTLRTRAYAYTHTHRHAHARAQGLFELTLAHARQGSFPPYFATRVVCALATLRLPPPRQVIH